MFHANVALTKLLWYARELVHAFPVTSALLTSALLTSALEVNEMKSISRCISIVLAGAGIVALVGCASQDPNPIAEPQTVSSPVGEPSGIHPRDPAEWQGMLVDLDSMAPCDITERCGLAMACIAEKCGPCELDAECAENEVCVLDHCVIKENAGCRSYRDCDDDALCVLSGYSSDPRGNSDMRAYCLSTSGGSSIDTGTPTEE